MSANSGPETLAEARETDLVKELLRMLDHQVAVRSDADQKIANIVLRLNRHGISYRQLAKSLGVNASTVLRRYVK